jgi:hypothetical protein
MGRTREQGDVAALLAAFSFLSALHITYSSFSAALREQKLLTTGKQ